MKKTIWIIIALVIVGGAAVAYYMYQKPVESLRDAEVAASLPGTELFSEFEQDLAASNKKYVGKVLKVNGQVIDKLTNADSSQTLVLASSDPIFGVKCRLDPKDNPATIPGKGATVTVKGLCTGLNADVELNQCIILKK
jgi:hypothetical protein